MARLVHFLQLELIEKAYTHIYKAEKKSLLRNTELINFKDSISLYTRLEREINTINLYRYEYHFNTHKEIISAFELMYKLVTINTLKLNSTPIKNDILDLGYNLEEFTIFSEEAMLSLMEGNSEQEHQEYIEFLMDLDIDLTKEENESSFNQEIDEEHLYNTDEINEQQSFWDKISSLNLDGQNLEELAKEYDISIPQSIYMRDEEVMIEQALSNMIDKDTPLYLQGTQNKIIPFKKALNNRYLKITSNTKK